MSSVKHALRGSFLVVLAASFAAGGGQQQVVRVSPQGTAAFSEVSVSIDPTEPNRIIAVAMEQRKPPTPTQPPATNVAFVSSDGGASWKRVEGPNPDGRTQGDDAVRFSRDGVALWSYISFRGLREHRPRSAASGIFVNRSEDGGESWSPPVEVVDHRNTTAPFEDKPTLAVDGERVYLAWTRFSRYGSADPRETSDIYFSLSEDGGRSFAMPVRVSDEAGDASDSDGTLEGAVPAVGNDGEVYLVWSGPKGIVFDRSRDGGWTFGADRVLFTQPGGWDLDVEGLGRANGMPVIGIDRGRGRFRGTLYVNWVDGRNGDPDVFVAHSRDRGESWSPPVRVNDDPVGNGAAQFFTWMAVDPVDGSVNVVFYDRRGLSRSETGVTVARSDDGGVIFRNRQVEIAPFETRADIFFGDYIGIDAFAGRIAAVFPVLTAEGELALFAARLGPVAGSKPGPGLPGRR